MPRTLSEAESKRLLAAHGVPVADERVVPDAEGAVRAAIELGFPVVAKLCGDAIAHKTERGLVRLRLGDGRGQPLVREGHAVLGQQGLRRGFGEGRHGDVR